MHAKGVAATTLDDIRAASGTSKSQLYSYFSGKDAVVREVVEAQATALLERQEQQLRRLGSPRGAGSLARHHGPPQRASQRRVRVPARLPRQRARRSERASSGSPRRALRDLGTVAGRRSRPDA
ncbi:TetR/AcrR family transcriptional regulator [Actinophytocola sp.]|uniref:TetR/AcrR family transcriptional regulator n=1 Tax=Actinophytocola sp. TaxID=1872138 RepID=UPI00345BAF7D